MGLYDKARVSPNGRERDLYMVLIIISDLRKKKKKKGGTIRLTLLYTLLENGGPHR